MGRILYREDFLLHVRFAVREGGPDAFVQLRRFLKALSRRECPGRCVTYRRVTPAPPTPTAPARTPTPADPAPGTVGAADAPAGLLDAGERLTDGPATALRERTPE